jgi:tetratricopeptide (TPR) repeat protein
MSSHLFMLISGEKTMEEDCLELAVLKRAVAEEPGNAANWLAYGRALLDRDRGNEALKALQKAFELAPDTPAIRFCLGCSLAMVGKHDEAIRHFLAVVGDDPELEDPLSALGLSALMCMAESQGALGNWKEAVETVSPTVKMAIDILSHVAGFLQKAGQYDLALGLSSICLLLMPDDPELLHATGYNKMKLGRLEEALDDLRHALKLDPQTPDIWYDYGVTLARMNKRKEARPIFRKVLRLDPRYFWAYYDLACLDAMEENRDAAFRNLNRAVDCGFRDAAYLVHDSDFQGIRADPRWDLIVERIVEIKSNVSMQAWDQPLNRIECQREKESDKGLSSGFRRLHHTRR